MTTKLTQSVDELAKMFEYLDELRAKGAVNMFGAGPYLRRSFPLNQGQSHAVLSAWMDTFSHDETVELRAQRALGNQEISA